MANHYNYELRFKILQPMRQKFRTTVTVVCPVKDRRDARDKARRFKKILEGWPFDFDLYDSETGEFIRHL